METLLSVFTWGLPCSQLKAASLYVMGNLGLRILIDVMEVVLWGVVSLLEVELLEMLAVGELDSVDIDLGLLAPIFSSVVHGVGGAGQVPRGNVSARGTHG